MSDLNKIEKDNIKVLSPFKLLVLQNFPFIEADFDAITNYQLMCKMVEYMNNINTNVNTLNENENRVYNAFNEIVDYINNYFDNLDVQNEINNKLDKMAESGELAEIITLYLNTFGVNIKQFGAVGDGITDDTTSIINAINYAKNHNIKLISPKDATYLVSSPLDISNMSCDFNFATFKTNSEIAIFTYNSTEYYADIKNITIDCNNIATDGLKIINGRKVLIDNINIINVGNNGFSYLKGYEMLVNNINIYGNVISNNNVGLNIEGGDSYFNNIIIIDCLTSIKQKNAFNYFNNVHSWMYRNPYILSSKFLEINGGRAVLNNCYSDTYRYCIYQKESIPILLISNFVNVYNRGLLTPEKLDGNHPYFMYCETAAGNSLTRLTNSNIDGYSDTILTYLTNLDNFSGEIVSSLIKNCDNNISFAPLSDSNNTTGVEILTSNVNKVGKIVYVDGQFRVDATSTKTFIIGTIPYYFRPSHEIITETSYGSRYSFSGMCYMYIATNGRVTITLPDDVTGNQVIKLNSSFITNVEQ